MIIPLGNVIISVLTTNCLSGLCTYSARCEVSNITSTKVSCRARRLVIYRYTTRLALWCNILLVMRNAFESGSNGDVGHARSSTGSEVVLTEGGPVAATVASGIPAISALNISKSSRIHVGPKFVSVTQNVTTEDGIKGKFLCLEVVSAKSKRRMRCSIAVFVCWAFIAASGLAVYLFSSILPKEPTRLDICLNEPWYLRRTDWQALQPYDIDYRPVPVKYVIIGHTVSAACTTSTNCKIQVMTIQQQHQRRGFNDIGPNYLIGGTDGLVFEGRGANVIGVMVHSWNTKSVSIMFIGDYRTNTPNDAQMEHLNQFLNTLARENIITPDYIVFGHCQVSSYTLSPGPHIMDMLYRIPHWNRDNVTTCLRS